MREIADATNLHGRDHDDDRHVTRSTIDIVHDLANALTAIRGSADVVRHEIDANGAVARNVARIIHSTEEAMALTRELRASVHPEAAAELPWP